METPCIFCDRKNLEERIIYEDEIHYVVASLGQLTGGYVLLIPKIHSACMGAMGDQEIFFLDRLKDKVIPAITDAYGCAPILFEHGIVGQSIKHTHIHLFPADIEITKKVRSDFKYSKIKTVTDETIFATEYRKERLPYLLWKDNSGITRICWDPNAPMQYFRIVIAQAIQKPKLADWKNLPDKMHDKWLWKDTMQRLKPYF